MKPFGIILTAILFAVIAAFATVKVMIPTAVNSTAAATPVSTNNAVYDRVMKSGQLNCGYVIYAPYFTKDANTGQLGGIFYDMTNELGKRLNLKINWAVESGWATFVQDITSGKVDAVCSGLWAESASGKQIGYSSPLLFAGVEAYVRADDTRFDNNMAAINSPDIKIATSDGSVSGMIGQTDYPLAKQDSLPNLSDYAQVIEEVVTGKADVTFIETPKAIEYLAKNPGKIKKILPGTPSRVYRTVYAMKQDEVRLHTMFNTALGEMLDSGVVEKILEKYEAQNGQVFYRVAQPYKAGESK